MGRFAPHVQNLARQMAEAVNGGSWETDYVEAQRVGWCLKVIWALENIGREEKS